MHYCAGTNVILMRYAELTRLVARTVQCPAQTGANLLSVKRQCAAFAYICDQSGDNKPLRWALYGTAAVASAQLTDLRWGVPGDGTLTLWSHARKGTRQ